MNNKMKEKLARVGIYLQKLSKLWISRATFILEIIVYLANLFIPSVNIPSIIYWIVAIFGLIIANFQIYNDLLLSIPTPHIKIPNLEIDLLEGNEYSFKRSEIENVKPHIPSVMLVIHLRVLYSGPCNIDVLTIDCSGKYIGNSPFLIYSNLSVLSDLENNKIKFPFQLEVGEPYLCNLAFPIKPEIITDAQFAARLRQYSQKPIPFIKPSIRVEVLDGNHEITSYSKNVEILLNPLWDIYIKTWKEMEYTDLIRLSNPYFE